MLRGLDPLLTADLLHALRAMGHGDTIAIVDANFPAVSTAQRLITLPGADADATLSAVLSVLPIDDFVAHPVTSMQVVGDPETVPPAVSGFTSILARHAAPPPRSVPRERFYALTREAFAVVATADRRLYANLILTKGVIRQD